MGAEGRTSAVTELSARRPAKVQPKPRAPPKAKAGTDASPADPTAKFRAAAQRQAMKALKTLAHLAANASSEAVRVSAANSIIDRAHGRPAQAVRVGGRREDDESGELTFAWLSPEPPARS